MSQAKVKEISTVPILVGGELRPSQADQWGEVYNPSQGKVIGRVPMCAAEEAAEVVEVAAAAFPEWANTPVVDRCGACFACMP